MNPRGLSGDKLLHWLPDATKGEDGNFQTFDALLGRDKTDKDCPGLAAKENDRGQRNSDRRYRYFSKINQCLWKQPTMLVHMKYILLFKIP